MKYLFLSIIAIMCLCVNSCGNDNDEPTHPSQEDTSKEFVYNHTPLNDYLVSFAGDTDGLTTEEVLERSVTQLNNQKQSLVGTNMDFISTIRLTSNTNIIESGWHPFEPIELANINGFPIEIGYVMVYIANDDLELYKNLYWGTQFEIKGKLHDFNINIISESATEKKHLEYDVVLDDATIKTIDPN